jgi:hypothetical protein
VDQPNLLSFAPALSKTLKLLQGQSRTLSENRAKTNILLRTAIVQRCRPINQITPKQLDSFEL